MELEIIEQYSNMKLELYKANQEIIKLKNELDIHKRETVIVMEESIMLDDLKELFYSYGDKSIYVKDEYIADTCKWLNDNSNFPLIKE